MTQESRKKRIQFHVASHDYFATLATIISFLRESLQKDVEMMKNSSKEMTNSATALKRLHDDLLYLQQEFEIVKKPS